MKVFIHHNLLICAIIVFSTLGLGSCSDDEPQIAPQPIEDDFAGSQREIILSDGLEDFHQQNYQCVIATEDGTIITRSGTHRRVSNSATLTLDTGLRAGTYRLLYLKTPEVEGNDTTWVEYGLGCRIKVDDTGAEVLDTYNPTLQMYGEGSANSPYVISCSDHLKKLRNITNDGRDNAKITADTYFSQEADIDMHAASKTSDGASGWMPIGNMPNYPFRGVYKGNGHQIQRLWINRPYSAGVGLFGYVENAEFDDLHIVNPDVKGTFAVGTIAGAAVTEGDRRCSSAFFNCSTTGGSVACDDGSVAVGGLVGEVDKGSLITFDGCENKHTKVSGSYGIGGIVGVGALQSSAAITDCTNTGSITSHYTGCGGLAGVTDTLEVTNSSNSGDILGSTKYSSPDGENAGFGTGGLVGGTGMSYIYTSVNEGSVKGHTGVGGLVGSTRVSTEEGLYNNCMVYASYNTGEVSGQTSVGGICGEAQFGASGVYNTGTVTGEASDCHVGGIVGNTSITSIFNTINIGKVCGKNVHAAGGLVGKTTWGSIHASQNMGDIDVSADYAGGIAGLAGNYTVMNYCANTAKVSNSGNGPTGGIVGEIGDPREWEPLDIANCVIGSLECVLGALGPVMAVTGEALEATESTLAIIKFLKELHFVIEIGETLLDAGTIAYDLYVRFYSTYGMIAGENYQAHMSEIEGCMKDNETAVINNLKEIRTAYAFANSSFSSSLNSKAISPYMDNVGKVVEFGQTSENNSKQINYNMNKAREERFEDVESSKLAIEITHKVISGVCLIVSIASMLAAPFTGGTSLGLTVLAAGTVSSITGGANAIIESCDAYKANVVVVSQCANMGNIVADNSDKVGGIAGHFQQFCYMNDCLNVGAYAGSSSNNSGIVDRADALSEVINCLNVGSNWGSNICRSSHFDCVFTHNYYFKELNGNAGNGDSLDKDALARKSSFDGWSFSGDLPLWSLTEEAGYFPIPLKSEMQETAKEIK